MKTSWVEKTTAVLLFAMLLSSAAGGQSAELRVQAGHTAQVHAVAISPDGLTWASGSSDRTVKIWEAATGQLLRTLAGHRGAIFSLAFSPDSRTIASGGREGEIVLWDRETGSLLATLTSSLSTVGTLVFSADGSYLYVGGVGTKVEKWSIADRQKEAFGDISFHDPIAISIDPKANLIAVASESTELILLDAGDGTLRRRLRVTPAMTNAVAFSPDGSILAVADMQGNVDLLDTRSWEPRTKVDAGPYATSSLAFLNATTLLVSSGGDGIFAIDIRSGQKTTKFDDRDEIVSSLAVDRERGRVLSASFWKLKAWDAFSGRLLESVGETISAVNSVAFSPTGRGFAVANLAGGIRIFNKTTGEIESIEPMSSTSWDGGTQGGGGEMVDMSVPALAFSSDGRKLISESMSTIGLWSVDSGESVGTFGDQWASAIAIAPDGSAISEGTSDGWIRTYSTSSTKQLYAERPFKDRIRVLEFSRSGDLMLAADDSTIQVLLPSLKSVRTIPFVSTARRSSTFAGSGDALAMCNANKLKLLDLVTGGNRSVDLPSSCNTLAYSPRSRMVAIGTLDRDVILVDTPTGTLRKFVAHDSSVNSLAFSPDGLSLLTGGADGTAKLWDVRTLSAKVMIVPLPDGKWVVTDPAGRFDTNQDLSQIEGLNWVVSDQPLKTRPLELFWRQYYEPGLLARLWKCSTPSPCPEEFRSIPSVGGVNRAQAGILAIDTRSKKE